jgi:DNA primase
MYSVTNNDDLPDIVDVLKYYGASINRTSGQVNVKCPFHNDSHASASFNTRQNIFNCFACGMNGNSIQIIAKKEGCDIREAKSIAEGITGQSNSQVRGKYSSGGRLPSKSGNHKGSSTSGAIRRSRSA